jgi:serine/threonine protein phosphatase PrpC
MMTIIEPIVWRIISESIRGASHERSGLPNQDAIKLFPTSAAGRAVAVAVADGHGGAKSFRSSLGARFAVESSGSLAESLLAQGVASMSLSAIKRLAEDEVPKRLTRDWRARVAEHVQSAPFKPEELAVLGAPGTTEHAGAETDATIAYGSTVLTVVVTERYMLFWQLGDGDIVIVTTYGQAVRPLPADDLLLGNETTSLCSPQAWRFVRVGFQALYDPVPALVLVSTDGLANSFADDAGFLQFGTDIRQLIEASGPGAVEDSLAGWLTQITERASGDDITLAIITHGGAAPGDRPAPSDRPAPGDRHAPGAGEDGGPAEQTGTEASISVAGAGEREEGAGDTGPEPMDERGA